MRETQRATDILKQLRDHHDCFAFNIAGSYYQMRGVPDSLIIHNGIHIFVEFKGAKTVIEPLQHRIIEQMRSKGANVFIVRFAGPKEWIINDLYPVEFSTLKEGVANLFHTLLDLVKSRTTIQSYPIPTFNGYG